MIRRAPLERYTPLLSKTPLRRKKPLAPVSAKRRREDARTRGAKDAFALAFPVCWLCGWRGSEWNPIDVHHLAGRAHQDRDDRRNWARLCRLNCHEAATNGLLTLPTQLALKFLFDPVFYDPPFVCRLKGWAPTAIDEDEIMEAARCLS